MHLNGGKLVLVKCHLMGRHCRKWTYGQKIYVHVCSLPKFGKGLRTRTYSRKKSQVSVYRTTGPLVFLAESKKTTFLHLKVIILPTVKW